MSRRQRRVTLSDVVTVHDDDQDDVSQPLKEDATPPPDSTFQFDLSMYMQLGIEKERLRNTLTEVRGRYESSKRTLSEAERSLQLGQLQEALQAHKQITAQLAQLENHLLQSQAPSLRSEQQTTYDAGILSVFPQAAVARPKSLRELSDRLLESRSKEKEEQAVDQPETQERKTTFDSFAEIQGLVIRLFLRILLNSFVRFACGAVLLGKTLWYAALAARGRNVGGPGSPCVVQRGRL